MKLLRLAIVHFHSELDGWRSWQMAIGDVDVRTHGLVEDGDPTGVVIGAEVALDGLPSVTDEGLVCVPEEQRTAAEGAIEAAANLVSIHHGCRRRISSPTPCVVFLPEDDETRAWLDGTEGVATHATGVGMGRIDLDDVYLPAALQDRLDGAALLAEALSHDHATGRLHDCVRVFERAFRLGGWKLIQPLGEFLATGCMGYSNEEIGAWIRDVRDPATHADRRPTFLTEAEVRPFLPRIETAAYDVLLNKMHWRSKTTERRRAWRPKCWVGCDGTSITGTAGTPVVAQFVAFDDFGRYPRHLKAFLNNMPDEWWYKFAPDERVADSTHLDGKHPDGSGTL